jgi:hypothetical protein
VKVTGYGVVAEWDGQTLTATGTNTAGRAALGGQVEVLRADIAGAAVKPASGMTNGRLTVTTGDGARHHLHFRKKDQPAWQELAAALGSPEGDTSLGRPRLVGPSCTSCGGSQFTRRRSKKGVVTVGVFAPKSQLECVTCGTKYKRA